MLAGASGASGVVPAVSCATFRQFVRIPHLAEKQPAVRDGDLMQGLKRPLVRTLTAKLAHERSTNRKRIAELEAALAAAHGQILHLRRQNLRLPDDTA